VPGLTCPYQLVFCVVTPCGIVEDTNVSEEYTASIFRAEDGDSIWWTYLKICLEMGHDVFLQNSYLLTIHVFCITFSLRRTGLAIHIRVEGCGEKFIMSWTVSETVFNFRSSISGIHLKTDNSCISPYNCFYCKDVVC
jgi:hypothetical protein